MKLERELAFLHSKSFDFKDKDQDSAAYKSQNQKVREYENRVSMNAPDLDLSHGMESADCKTAPKLKFSNGVVDQKNNFEAKGMEFFKLVTRSPNDIAIKFPNDTGSVKRSPTSPVSDHSNEMKSFESSMDVYVDKSVTESAKESNYHVVKDICVDEGVPPTLEKLLFGNIINAKDNYSSPPDSFRKKEVQDDNNEISVLNVTAKEESDQVSARHVQSNDLIHKDEVVTEKPLDNVNKEMVLPEENLEVQESDIQGPRPSPVDKVEQQVSGEPESNTNSEESKNMIEEAELATSYPLPLPVHELNTVNKLLEDRSLTYHFDPSVTATSGISEINLEDSERNETPAITSQGRYSSGESSFSAAGHLSGRISYSGPVPYSGSISIRSDSSTTSTRSFAFPVLQSEWCNSPVRMAKADKRSYRKHRGSKLLCCCRF